MEKEEHSMDELFRTVLKEQETPPPADAWFNIQKELDSRKRIRFIWTLRALAATVTLLVTFASGYYIATYKNNSSRLAELQNAKAVVTNTIPLTNDNQSITVKSNLVEPKKNNNNKTSPAFRSKAISNSKSNALENQLPSSGDGKTLNSGTAVFNRNEPASIENLALAFLIPIESSVQNWDINSGNISRIDIQPNLYSNTNGEEIVIEDQPVTDQLKGSRWSLGGQVSPLYAFRQTSGSSGPAVNSAANQASTSPAFKESGIVSYSGGLNVEFKASKRLSVSSGLYYSRMGQNINGNLANPSYTNVSNVKADQYFNYAFQNSTGILKTNSTGGNSPATIPSGDHNPYDLASSYLAKSATVPASAGESATLFQSMDFVEIPVLVRYKLIDRKIGLHLLGGLSTQLLAGNKLTLETASAHQDYGSTSGLSTFNYSSTLGFGIDYTVTANIHFNLEPAFKYYINSINSAGSIESHPYSFGVYTGMRYTF